MNWTPGPLNSILISTENAVPNNPENNAKIKYKVPLFCNEVNDSSQVSYNKYLAFISYYYFFREYLKLNVQWVIQNFLASYPLC